MPATLLATAAKSMTASDSTARRAIDALPSLPTNVGNTERVLSMAIGAPLAVFGFNGRGPSLLSVLAGGFLISRAVTGNCMGYRLLGLSTSGPSSPNAVIPAGQGTRVVRAVTVNKPANVLYMFWRDFQNLPRFMSHLEEVEVTGDRKSHWVARGPLGLSVEWDAEIVTDEPGRVIAWKSLEGSDVDTAGSVQFHELPGDRGTEVRVELKYDPPAGKLGSAVAKLFGEEPSQQIREDLRRFKEILEAGEVPSTAGQPRGR